jgi:hypothetical protein
VTDVPSGLTISFTPFQKFSHVPSNDHIRFCYYYGFRQGLFRRCMDQTKPSV